MTSKRVPEIPQFNLKLKKVVHLTVVHERASTKSHGLRPIARQVDDAQSTVSESHAFADERPITVRAPMSDRLRHSPDGAVEFVG